MDSTWKTLTAGAVAALLMVAAVCVSYRIGLNRGRRDVIIPPPDTVTTYKEIKRYTPEYARTLRVGTVAVPQLVQVTDTTCRTDTVYLPREQRIYREEQYTAYVSGVDPVLDSIALRLQTVTVTRSLPVETIKRRRWGFGLQAGIGGQYGLVSRRFDAGPYLGVGLSFNF